MDLSTYRRDDDSYQSISNRISKTSNIPYLDHTLFGSKLNYDTMLSFMGFQPKINSWKSIKLKIVSHKKKFLVRNLDLIILKSIETRCTSHVESEQL